MKKINFKKIILFLVFVLMFNWFEEINFVVENNHNHIYASDIETYTDFQGWGIKLWGDEGGDCEVNINYDNFMQIKANNSYVTSYGGDIYRNEKSSNNMTMIFDVVTTKSSLLDHIYCGYVLKNGEKEDDIYYYKATVKNKKTTGDYTYATMQLTTNIKSVGNFFLQIRLGKNNDRVSGQIDVTEMRISGTDIVNLNTISVDNDSWSINSGVLKIKKNMSNYSSLTYTQRPWEIYSDIMLMSKLSDELSFKLNAEEIPA